MPSCASLWVFYFNEARPFLRRGVVKVLLVCLFFVIYSIFLMQMFRFYRFYSLPLIVVPFLSTIEKRQKPLSQLLILHPGRHQLIDLENFMIQLIIC